MIYKIVCLVLCVLMLLQAVGMRVVAGTWIYPACLYGLFWFAFTFFPVLLVPETYSSPAAVAYILLSCLVVSLGGIGSSFGKLYRATPGFEAEDRALFGSETLRNAFVVTAFGSVVFLIIDAGIQGITLRALLTDFYATSNAFLAKRYSDTLIANIFTSLATLSNYVATVLGGLYFWAATDRSRLYRLGIIVLAFVPSVFVLTVQAAKGTIFLAMALFCAGILICRVRARQDIPVNWHTAFLAARLLIVLVPLLVVSFMARGLYEVQTTGELLFSLRRLFTSYALGHLYAFSDWFDFYIGIPSQQFFLAEKPTLGFYSFMALFKLAGDTRYVPPGVYEEYYNDGYLVATNIYTAFRGLITDFTIPGSLAVILLCSMVIHGLFFMMIRESRSALGMAIFVAFCAFLASSYIISVFIWNSVYALFAAVWLFLAVLFALRARRSGAAPTALESVA